MAVSRKQKTKETVIALKCGLRNVALTAPYFHDGTQATLEDAVIAMAKYEVGVDLSKQEVAQMVSFLRTLTGEYQGKLLVNENDLQK